MHPNATIYLLDEGGIRQVAYEETEHYQLTRRFLTDTDRMMNALISEEEDWFKGTLRD